MRDEDFSQLEFRVYCNIHYHSFRSKFYNGLDKAINFLLIIFGTTIFSEVISPKNIYSGLFLAILAVVQFVFDLRGKCVQHEWFKKLYYNLLSEIIKCDRSDELKRIQFNQEIIKISSDEPSELKLLNIIAHNTTIDSLGYPSKMRRIIPTWKSLLAHFISFENYLPKTEEENDNNKN